jgi:hypothetical protein
MLTVRSSRHSFDCDGASRRDFLRIGSLALGGLTLPELLRARAGVSSASAATIASPVPTPTKDTSVVLLWLSGGPTHIETFDPKMSAPVEYRSAVGSVTTNVPGIDIGGPFQQMAKLADKMAFVRSFAHGNSSHGIATQIVMSGHDTRSLAPMAAATKPSCGSMTAKFRGESNKRTGMPTYVRLGNINGDGPAFLGKAYAPFETAGEARNNMNLVVPAERMSDRRSLLGTLDRINREADASGMMNGLDAYAQQAYGLILGAAKTAFDIEQEDARTRNLYGDDLGLSLLKARRLCEAGCGFVSINFGGWDMHGGVGQPMKRRGEQVDRAVAAFVQDCAQRGLSEKILLVVTGEFGRTPRINKNGGRDHWGPLCTLALSGGGLRMGQVVGESTEKAEVPKTTPISPANLMATLFHVLGMPQNLHYNDPAGRPVPMLAGGKPIAELI